ncbi:MAG: rRNA maturation RNase YbeY [Gammaproteobacteria bacterium]|nr:rRNA maturation RNase YbeY [Gammaproteobacteria bacterium]
MVVQRACPCPEAPDDDRIASWAEAAFQAGGPPGRGDPALTIRVVDEDEAAALNHTYRGRDYAPNVLSFPMNTGESFDTGLLGDVVICAAVLEREAAEQGKIPEAHWAHLVIHGVLHCCGFEHDSTAGARRMESLEKRILADFGFPDPYTLHNER